MTDIMREACHSMLVNDNRKILRIETNGQNAEVAYLIISWVTTWGVTITGATLHINYVGKISEDDIRPSTFIKFNIREINSIKKVEDYKEVEKILKGTRYYITTKNTLGRITQHIGDGMLLRNNTWDDAMKMVICDIDFNEKTLSLKRGENVTIAPNVTIMVPMANEKTQRMHFREFGEMAKKCTSSFISKLNGLIEVATPQEKEELDAILETATAKIMFDKKQKTQWKLTS